MSLAFFEALSMALRLELFSMEHGHSSSNLPSTDFASMSLGQRGEDGIGERKLCKVLGEIVFHLIRLEALYTKLSVKRDARITRRIPLSFRPASPRTSMAAGS